MTIIFHYLYTALRMKIIINIYNIYKYKLLQYLQYNYYQ